MKTNNRFIAAALRITAATTLGLGLASTAVADGPTEFVTIDQGGGEEPCFEYNVVTVDVGYWTVTTDVFGNVYGQTWTTTNTMSYAEFGEGDCQGSQTAGGSGSGDEGGGGGGAGAGPGTGASDLEAYLQECLDAGHMHEDMNIGYCTSCYNADMTTDECLEAYEEELASQPLGPIAEECVDALQQMGVEPATALDLCSDIVLLPTQHLVDSDAIPGAYWVVLMDENGTMQIIVVYDPASGRGGPITITLNTIPDSDGRGNHVVATGIQDGEQYSLNPFHYTVDNNGSSEVVSTFYLEGIGWFYYTTCDANGFVIFNEPPTFEQMEAGCGG